MKSIKIGKPISFFLMVLALSLAFSLVSHETKARDDDPAPGTLGATCGRGAAKCNTGLKCCGLTSGGHGSGTCEFKCTTSLTPGVFSPVGSPTVTTDGGANDSSGTSGTSGTVTSVIGYYEMSDGTIMHCNSRVTANDPGGTVSNCNPVQVTNIETLKISRSATDRGLSESIIKSVTTTRTISTQ